MKILIDPGHGGEQLGRVVGSIFEKDFNLDFSLQIAQDLQKHGHEVCLTRYTDTRVSLEERVTIERMLASDLFLSIHCNGYDDPRAHGMEVFTSIGDTASDPIAEKIINALRAEFPHRWWRTNTVDGDQDKEESFYVLKNTQGPAVLVEVEFMTNPAALEFLSQPSTPMKLGSAIVAALGD